MDGVDSEIYMISMYMNMNCFYSQVDTATTNTPNMLDSAWFQARLDQLCATGDIADAERRIYESNS